MAFSLLSKKLVDFQSENVLTLFAQIEDQPWSFLLDSCRQTQMGGRYDILVQKPCITYEYKLGEHTLSGEWTGTASHDASPITPVFSHALLKSACPYENLAGIQEKFDSLFDTQHIEDSHIPFMAGALGVFAYDGNVSTDNIIDEKPNQYSLPDISVGFYHSSIVFDNLHDILYIFSIDETFITNVVFDIAQLDTLNKKEAKNSFELLAPWQSNITMEEYCKTFTKIENYLRAGDCYQVNFAQRFNAPYRGSEWQAYCKLRWANKAPFSAFVRLPKSTILSLSPERFLLVKDNCVETKPIKGTRKRDSDPIRDQALATELLNAEKDRAENLMIVDLLRNDLSKYCEAHSVKVPKLFALESYPAVHHMVSTVEAKLKKDASVYELLKGAFPGGSITGAPKVRAMQIIQELEPDKRAIYCGTIGYIDIRGNMDSNICIRTLLAQQGKSPQTSHHQTHSVASNQLFCWAGGGIVIDSTDSDEYFESLHKVAKILPVLDPSYPVADKKVEAK